MGFGNALASEAVVPRIIRPKTPPTSSAGLSNSTTVDTIKAFIISERRSNFAFLGRYSHQYMNGEDLAVYLAEDDEVANLRRRWNLSATDLENSTCFTFCQTLSSLTDTVPIRSRTVSQSPDIAALEALDVDATKAWIPLRDWMIEKYEWHDTYERKLPRFQQEEMTTWWESNGKHFALLDLPGEMREALYLEIIGRVIVPRVKTCASREKIITVGSLFGNGRNVNPENTIVVDKKTGNRHRKGSKEIAIFGNGLRGGQGRPGARLDPEIEPPNLAILATCRRVHDEVLDAVWRQATKRFRASSCNHLALANKDRVPLPDIKFKKLAPPNALRKVQLEFSARCYFQLLAIEPAQEHPFLRKTRGGFHIAMLKAINTIQDLDFRFMSPKHRDAVCPWYWGTLGMHKHSCQKTWVDWFFTFALAHLDGCNFNITMSGCVKNSTRAKWEPILQDVVNGVEHDLTAQREAIWKSKQNADPLPCHCTFPCSTNGMAQWELPRSGEERFITGLQEEIEEVADRNYFSFAD